MSHDHETKPRTATFAFKSAAEDGAAGDKGAKNKHVRAAARAREGGLQAAAPRALLLRQTSAARRRRADATSCTPPPYARLRPTSLLSSWRAQTR